MGTTVTIAGQFITACDYEAPGETVARRVTPDDHARVGAPSGPSLDELRFRYVGPMGTRVTAIAAIPGDPSVIYAGTPTGGIFKSVDGGTDWQAIFDNDDGIASIGAITLDPSNPNIVWVGTGESFMRELVAHGNGVYRSTDAGATWTHMGLEATGRVSRIIVDPKDPNTVFVASPGLGYAPSRDRGVFRTRDGGKSWELVLHVDNNTGAADLIMDPSDPNVLYAAAWQLELSPHGYVYGGPGSGIYRTRDGGASWAKLSGGLPTGPLGRIGLAVSRAAPKRIYAMIATTTPDVGTLWRSDDGGDRWSLINNEPMMMYRASYFSRLGAFPNNADDLIVLGLHATRSTDGGRTLTPITLGADPHGVWIDEKDPRRVIVNTDRYVKISMDRGATWRDIDLPNAQVYGVSADNDVPYNLYGSLQDGAGHRVPSDAAWPKRDGESRRVLTANLWETTPVSEVAVDVVDPIDDDTVWMISPWGNSVWNRKTKQSHSFKELRSGKERVPGEAFHDMPFATTAMRPRRIFTADTMVHESYDMGRTWRIISPDLTADALHQPQTPWTELVANWRSAISALAASPIERDVLWAGANDGPIHVTRDDGKSWVEVTKNIAGLPPLGIVTSIEASRYTPGTAYITVDRRRSDDFKPYVYKTSDYGATWTFIGGIPITVNSYARFIKEDPRRQGLLYLGTWGGLFMSADDGAIWTPLASGLPRVPVSGITVQERFNDLVISTFGRGFWILDDITAMQTFTPAVAASPSHLFEPRVSVMIETNPKPWVPTPDVPPIFPQTKVPSNIGEASPGGVPITYYLKTRSREPVAITFVDDKGKTVQTVSASGEPGIHRIWWTMRPDGGERLPPGEYRARMAANGASHEVRVTVLADPATVMDQPRRRGAGNARRAHRSGPLPMERAS